MRDNERFGDTRGRTALLIGWVAYALGYATHSAGHFANGMGHTPPLVLISGIAAIPVSVLLLFAILHDYRYAPLATGVLGSALAVGLVLVHIPVQWGPFSEPWYAHEHEHHQYVFIGYFSLFSVTASVVGTLIAAGIGFRVHYLRER